MRALRNIALSIFLIILILFGLVWLVAQSQSVQTYLAQRAADYLSQELNAEISIDRLEFVPIRSLALKGLQVRDQEGEDLLYAELMEVKIAVQSWRQRELYFSQALLKGADFSLRQIDVDGHTNLDFIVAYFAGEQVADTSRQTASSFELEHLGLQSCSFSYLNPFAEPVDTLPADGLTPAEVNLEDVFVSDINGSFDEISIRNDSIALRLSEFSFREKSGLQLNQLEGDLMVHPGGIELFGMNLRTPHSRLEGDLSLLHEDWSDYQDFVRKVQWKAELEHSRVHFADIAFFSREISGMDFDFFLSGKVDGSISSLRGRDMFIITGEHTILRGQVELSGLPDWKNTFIDLRLSQLSSDYDDLDLVRRRFEPQAEQGRLPLELQRAGALFFRGSFTGFPSDFVAFGELTTEAGLLDLDVQVREQPGGSGLQYTGRAGAEALDLGRVLDMPAWGSITARVELEAESDGQIQYAMLNGTIVALEFLNYSYKSLKVNGEVRSQRFFGELSSRDPNFDLDFNGLVDLGSAVPQFDFMAEVNNLDFKALKLIETEKELYFSSSLQMIGRGSSLNSFSGSLSASNSFVCYGDSTALVQEVVLSALGDRDQRKITLTSDFADLSLTGAFETSDIPRGLHQMAAVVMPSIADPEDLLFDTYQHYDFSLSYKAKNAISGMLLEGLHIAPQTTLYGSFNNLSGKVEALLRSSELRYKDFVLRDAVINAMKQSETAALGLFGSSFRMGGFEMDNPKLTLTAFNDLADVHYAWLGAADQTSGSIDFRISLFEPEYFALLLDTAAINARGSSWHLAHPMRMDVDSNGIFIDELLLANNLQTIKALGRVGSKESDELMVLVKDIDLAYIDSLDLADVPSLRGRLNVDLRARRLLEVPLISAEASIVDLAINDIAIGDLSAESKFDVERNLLEINATLQRALKDIVEFHGSLAVDGSEDPFSGTLYLKDLPLEMVNLFDLEDVNEFSGSGSGEVAINGALSAPRMQGWIDFDKARFRVDYLNTTFEFSDRVRVEEDWLGIDYKPIKDAEGNQGYLVASAFHNDFKEWSFDLSAEVERFKILDTDRTMNEVFYGSARATGFLQIGGFADFLEISIDAKTERGTSIKLPLDEPSEQRLENFVRFVNIEQEPSGRAVQADLEGISLRMNIEATPDAEIQLIFDERSNDIMRGRGRGMLTLEISPSGEFEMFGRYEITEGSYLFTLKNLINKQFSVRPGGTVSWYGDPYQAELDIDAVYALRTQLYPIMLENRERYRTREDVLVVLSLSDKIMNPSIAFDIELPQSTEIERSQLQTAVSTVQQLNQQVFALLILNRFLPVMEEQQEQGGGFAGLGSATTSDFVSTQISNWLSEISNDFEIGLNYRPGDQISNQEIAVALSTQLFNERVLLSGNFGVTSPTEMQYSRGQSGLVGDFFLEYLITEDGKVRLKVFNETNPYEVFSNAGSIYTQGVGLVYMEDFNTMEELIKKVNQLFSRKEKDSKIP